MANVLKLYYSYRTDNTQWELIPSKLLIVERIADYLATKTALTINNFQYVKNELEIGINVDLSQTYSQPLTSASFKYVSITNDGENTHYYYVKKIIWRSKSCVRLELVLDVLNTFKEDSDYIFKENTKINREHKSRFIIKNKVRYLVITFDDYNIIDELPSIDDPMEIRFGDSVIYSGNLSEYIYDGETLKGFKILIDAGETRTDNEILALFRGYSLNDVFSLYDTADEYELEFYFDGVPFTAPDEPLIIHDSKVYRNIDETPENINPILLCDSNFVEKVEHHKNKLKGDWYLLYRNQNDPTDSLVNPVDCFLIPEESGIQVDSGYITSGRIIPSWLEYGKYYYFYVSLTTTYTLSNGITISESDASHKTTMVIYKANNDTISVQVVRAIYNSTTEVIGFYTCNYISVSPVPADYNVLATFLETSYANYYTDITYPNSFNNSGTYKTLDTITSLDRTDAKNIKLIKLPYCPYDFTIVGGVLQISGDPNWEYGELAQSTGTMYLLKLHDLNTNLKGKIEDTTYNPLDYLYFGNTSNIDPALDDLREQANYESKLYHSEFFQPTFFYDSFSFKFELEKCYLFGIFANYTKTSVVNEIEFDMTRTINSKFMFTFKNYEAVSNNQNYAKYLPVARNNEEVLYNVPYINYVRSGYGYDVKNKNISNISNVLGVGLSAGSLAVSLAIPSAPLKVAGVVGSLVSMAMSVKNAVVSAVQNENSLKQKISQYQNQTSNVAGSDDVDLMSIYGENRLQYLEYEPRKDFEKLIFDLFFYSGYRSERMGIPEHNNRVNFDYLECDASLQAISSIPNDCLEELINCFKNGVTYLHYAGRVSDKWDFAQKYENWEKEFFE